MTRFSDIFIGSKWSPNSDSRMVINKKTYVIVHRIEVLTNTIFYTRYTLDGRWLQEVQKSAHWFLENYHIAEKSEYIL